MARKYYQGKFLPKNPKKYRGDANNIVYRSSWELKLMLKLDTNPNVIWWVSEETIIPYRSPVDGKVHRYFVDFLVHLKNTEGKNETLMIEVKPKKQTIEPKKQSKMTKTYLNEVFEWGKNQAKWKAAKEFCADRGWRFEIFSEKELGIK
jgi:hypothetical protein